MQYDGVRFPNLATLRPISGYQPSGRAVRDFIYSRPRDKRVSPSNPPGRPLSPGPSTEASSRAQCREILGPGLLRKALWPAFGASPGTHPRVGRRLAEIRDLSPPARLMVRCLAGGEGRELPIARQIASEFPFNLISAYMPPRTYAPARDLC